MMIAMMPASSRNLPGVRTSRLRVELCEVEPPVVRVLDVPAAVLLPELHNLVQAGLGWTDSHLHQFVADDACYRIPDVDGPDDELDESSVPLRALPDRFGYRYDFGDGWQHDIEVLGRGGDQPGCVDGHGACPPEDCGGPGGYAEFREALADPSHLEHTAMRTWAAHWRDDFDLAAADLLVRQTAGTIPAPVRLVLELAGSGVRLTPGGRLPRAFVRQVQQHYPSWGWAGRPASLEEDLLPLAALHDVLRQVGLLRMRHGVLHPTRAAGDQVQVVRRLRSWFGPEHGYPAVLAGTSVAQLATRGPYRPAELARQVFPLLDDRWVTAEGTPLTEQDVSRELYRLESVLVGLDLVIATEGSWCAGPSACWLLPRATGLAHLWSTRW